MKREIWKPVVGFEGLYEVSSFGRVRRSSDGGRYKKGKVLSFGLFKGYPRTHLCKNHKNHWCTVHKLVLEAFKGKRPEGKEASHLNDVKTDNHLSNLKWMTSGENKKLAYKNGRLNHKGKNHPNFGKKLSKETCARKSKSMKEYWNVRKSKKKSC